MTVPSDFKFSSDWDDVNARLGFGCLFQPRAQGAFSCEVHNDAHRQRAATRVKLRSAGDAFTPPRTNQDSLTTT